MPSIFSAVFSYILFLSFLSFLINPSNASSSPRLHIHVVPHTHLDAGWIYTVDEYYNKKVKKIYTNVLDSLTKESKKDRGRTFAVCEIIFFKRWYDEISETQKEAVRWLVQEGKMEFVLAGWVMPDEANPLFQDLIDNLRIGLQWVKETFKTEVKTSWSLDPFGHSSGNTQILRLFEYENIYIGNRLHYDIVEKMRQEKNFEFYWKPEEGKKESFSHVGGLHYGINLYLSCLTSYNTYSSEKAFKNCINNLLNMIINRSQGYRHDHYLFLFGDDFFFEQGEVRFEQLEKIIDYVNSATVNNINFSMSYSLPSKYFSLVKKILKKGDLKTFEGVDFFPYTDGNEGNYVTWSGYFTTRPYQKGLIKKASNSYYLFGRYFAFVNMIKFRYNFLFKSSSSPQKLYDQSDYLRKAIGLNMHHDAITGTEKHHVAKDYITTLRTGLQQMEKQFTDSIENNIGLKIIKVCYNNALVDHNECIDGYRSLIEENDKIILSLFNPSLSGPNLLTIEFPALKFTPKIEGVDSDFFCFEAFTYSSTKEASDTKCLMKFIYNFAEDESFVSFVVYKSDEEIMKPKELTSNTLLLENEGNIQRLEVLKENLTFILDFKGDSEVGESAENKVIFSYKDGFYKGKSGDGAYIFRTDFKKVRSFDFDGKKVFYSVSPVAVNVLTVNEVGVQTLFTLFYMPVFAVFEHFFPKIPYQKGNLRKNFDDKWTKNNETNYAFVIETDINNSFVTNATSRTHYRTDSNGLFSLQRISGLQSMGKMSNAENDVATKFFPVPFSISIKDKNIRGKEMTVWPDRPQSGSGGEAGKVILLLNRVSKGDDNRGLGINNFETYSIFEEFRTRHLVMFGRGGNGKFVNNHINFGLAYYFFPYSSDITSKLKFINDLFYSDISRYITQGSGISSYYQIINEHLIIAEFYRGKGDFLDNKIEEEEESNMNLYINFPENVNVLVKYDKMGIAYHMKFDELEHREYKRLVRPVELDFKIEENEVLFVYFYLLNKSS